MQNGDRAVPGHKQTIKLLVTVMLVQVCALSFRSWLQLSMEDDGMSRHTATNLSFFLMPPILVLLLYPVWREHKQLLISRLRWSQLSLKVVLIGLAVGVALRVASDGYLIARAAFGIVRNSDPDAILGPIVFFGCPPAELIALHVISLAFFVPLTEELINRGWLMQWLLRYGRPAAIIGSAILFTVLHRPDALMLPFVFGLYSAVLCLNSGSLWAAFIAHCVINALIIPTWHCLNVQWNPTETTNESIVLGVIVSLLSIFALGFAAVLSSKRIIGPGSDDPDS